MLTILGGIEVRRRTRLEGLAIYLGSLRAHHPTARVVLFNRSPTHPELRALINRYEVESIDGWGFEKAYGIPPVEIEIARFLAYAPWLEDHPCDDVVMTDVLDVAWQGPFACPDPLTVWEENKIVGTCPYNSSWVREVWPTRVTELLPLPVVCCGVIAGSRSSVLRYLHWYTEEFQTRSGVRRGFDSALINGYPDAVRLPYGHPQCIHLGYALPASVTWEDGAIVCGGIVPAIVHQYNRHPHAGKGLDQRWT